MKQWKLKDSYSLSATLGGKSLIWTSEVYLRSMYVVGYFDPYSDTPENASKVYLESEGQS